VIGLIVGSRGRKLRWLDRTERAPVVLCDREHFGVGVTVDVPADEKNDWSGSYRALID
jgi:hypothetical protein